MRRSDRLIVYSPVTDSYWLTDGRGNFYMEFPTETEAREFVSEMEREV